MRLATILVDGGFRPAVGRRDDGPVLPIDTRTTRPRRGVRAIAAGGPMALDRLASLGGRPSRRTPASPLDGRRARPGRPGSRARSTRSGSTTTARARRPRPDPPAHLRQGRGRRSAGHGATARLGPDRHRRRRCRDRARGRHRRTATGVSRPTRWSTSSATRASTTSRRATSWLDGDQWLLGKSMPGFCPVGPWIVTRRRPRPRRPAARAARINGEPIQDGRTIADALRRSPAIIAYLSRHLTLRPGDLIATGTPVRLDGPLGPDRHLEPGDVVTVWIEGIGELTTTIA